MKSSFGYHYPTKHLNLLDFNFLTLKDLDESIDILCDFFGEDEQDQSLSEEHCPYFGVMWEAGIGLSQYLTKDQCHGKRVLEIGCGLALPSFVATRYGADVLATDFHADVELFLKENQRANKIHFEYSLMNWRDELERTKTDFGLFDLVIGSDILYEGQHVDQVAKALIAFLNPGAKIILSDPGRAYVQKFILAMNALGYKEIMTTMKVEAKYTQKNVDKEVFIFEFSNLA